MSYIQEKRFSPNVFTITELCNLLSCGRGKFHFDVFLVAVVNIVILESSSFTEW